jgi:hypothetical protein
LSAIEVGPQTVLVEDEVIWIARYGRVLPRNGVREEIKRSIIATYPHFTEFLALLRRSDNVRWDLDINNQIAIPQGYLVDGLPNELDKSDKKKSGACR